MPVMLCFSQLKSFVSVNSLFNCFLSVFSVILRSKRAKSVYVIITVDDDDAFLRLGYFQCDFAI